MLEDASNFLVVLAADIKEQTATLDSAIDDLQDAAEEETITVSKWAVLDDADDLLANAKRAAAKLEAQRMSACEKKAMVGNRVRLVKWAPAPSTPVICCTVSTASSGRERLAGVLMRSEGNDDTRGGFTAPSRSRPSSA